MKGDINLTTTNKLQCNFCHAHPNRGTNKDCPFCNRMRRIEEECIPKVKR